MRLSSLLLPVAVLAALTPAPAASAASADLSARVAALRPGAVLQLPSGDYPALSLAGKRWSTPVTVRAARGAQVRVVKVDLDRVSGLHLEGLVVKQGYRAVGSSRLSVVRSRLPSVDLRRVTDVRLAANRILGDMVTPSAWRGVTVYSNLGAGEPRNARIVIEDNEIARQQEDNVFLGPADDVLIRRNRIHSLPPTEGHQDGVQTMDSRRLRIIGNEFWGQDDALMLKAETGLWPQAVVGPVLIQDNITRDSRGAGFILVDTTDATVVNNTGVRNGHADLHHYRETGLVVTRNVFAKVWSAGEPKVAPAVAESNCVRWFGSARDVAADPLHVPGSWRLAPASPCRDAQGVWGARR